MGRADKVGRMERGRLVTGVRISLCGGNGC